MTTTLKVREKGVVILPRELRKKAGIKEGSIITASAFDEGIIILSPKWTNTLAKLLGIAKLSKGTSSPSSVWRVRSLRSRADKELELDH